MIPITPISIESVNLAMAAVGAVAISVGGFNTELRFWKRLAAGTAGVVLLFVVLFGGPDPLVYRLLESRCINGLCPGM